MLSRIALRKHPYPFKASLAICNDLDGFAFENFIELHRFLNTQTNTSLGTGLNLEIGDSFWMYCVDSDVSCAFSYFEGLSDEPSPYADAISKLVRAGYLDCLHTYGNFNQYGGFRRSYAEKAFAEMERRGMRVRTWVDHGDMHNFQNINYLGGMRERSIGGGVFTKIVEYHTDLCKKFGIKFYWPMIVTPLIGQGRRIGFRDIARSRNRRKWLAGSLLLYGVLRMMPHGVLERRPVLLRKKDQLGLLVENPLIYKRTLASGDKVYCFQRYGDWFSDGADSLGKTLSAENLGRLIETGGSSVVYVHMARKPAGCRGILPDAAVSAFKRIAGHYNAGNIYVTTTSRLLTFHMATENLAWRATSHGGRTVIDIDMVRDDIDGDFVPAVDDLQGITFYTGDPANTSIRLAGEVLDGTVCNPHDDTGRASVSIPRTHLKFPESL
ncbi:MAG: hypothetical protein HZA20_11115 [Nitrospirae bacterium]|nr:hypothetical protein [Nitrospirota bacterium]